MSNNTDPNPEQNQNQGKKPSRPTRLWVPFVVFIGALVGSLNYSLLLSLIVILPPPPQFGGFPEQQAIMAFETLLAVHIILSTVGIALLVALVVVYAQTYRATRANFVLGLMVVLLALLFQNILSYPVFYPFINITALRAINYSSPIADAFMVIAYTVFLYLSLE